MLLLIYSFQDYDSSGDSESSDVDGNSSDDNINQHQHHLNRVCKSFSTKFLKCDPASKNKSRFGAKIRCLFDCQIIFRYLVNCELINNVDSIKSLNI